MVVISGENMGFSYSVSRATAKYLGARSDGRMTVNDRKS
jgi:hypothetical protein